MSMIGVGTATGSAAGDLLGSPSHLNAAASTSRSSPSSGPVTTPAESGDRPAVVVDLSDSSKALLDRAKIAQAVADRRDRHMVVQNGRDHTQVPGSGSDVETAFSAASLSHAEPQTKWGPARNGATQRCRTPSSWKGPRTFY